MLIELRKRAQVERTDVYLRRIWMANDGRHRVSLFVREHELDHRNRKRKVYYAERLEWTATGPCWDIISRHRSKSAALKSCEQDCKKSPQTLF